MLLTKEWFSSVVNTSVPLFENIHGIHVQPSLLEKHPSVCIMDPIKPQVLYFVGSSSVPTYGFCHATGTFHATCTKFYDCPIHHM